MGEGRPGEDQRAQHGVVEVQAVQAGPDQARLFRGGQCLQGQAGRLQGLAQGAGGRGAARGEHRQGPARGVGEVVHPRRPGPFEMTARGGRGGQRLLPARLFRREAGPHLAQGQGVSPADPYEFGQHRGGDLPARVGQQRRALGRREPVDLHGGDAPALARLAVVLA